MECLLLPIRFLFICPIIDKTEVTPETALRILIFKYTSTHAMNARILIRARTPWASRTIGLLQPALRLYSTSNFDDAALRRIIETSNIGMAQKLEQQQKKTASDTVPEVTIGHKPLATKPSKPDLEATKKASTIKPTPTIDDVASINATIQKENNNLPSQKQNAQSDIARKFQYYLDSLQETIFSATRALNDVTGYSGIEKLKLLIDALEEDLKSAKNTVKDVKQQYAEAILRRSTLQREINELLTRKHNWSPLDVERFTELYRNDHINEQLEATSEQLLGDAELAVDSIQLKLTQLILTRYHEEQIWSDKIRQALTWGTWIIMGINVMLFTVATFFVEPWKRRRLVAAFNNLVETKMEEFSAEMKALATQKGVNSTPVLTPESIPSLYPVAFTSVSSFGSLKAWVSSTWTAVQNPSTSFHLERVDLGILSVALVAVGWSLGGVVNYALAAWFK